MMKKTFFRSVMLVAGLLAVGVILLSSSINADRASKAVAKAKTEQNSEEKAQTFVSAPTEAIPGSAVKIQDSTPSLLETLVPEAEEKSELPQALAKELVRYFKVLFTTFISPNAP